MAKRKAYDTRKKKYERCVKSVKKQKSDYNPYAVCRASIYDKK